MTWFAGRAAFRPIVILALGALAAAAACSGGAAAPPLTGEHAFALVYSESNFGQIEPCSCNNRQIGGFPRRINVVESLRKQGPLLVLDAGNSLFSEHIESGPQARQAKVKARAIAEAFVRTGLDAMTFGDLDLLAGGAFFKQIVDQTGLPIVAANVIDRKSGQPVFKPYIIKELDGVRVAVVGLVAQELRPVVSEVNAEGARRVAPSMQRTLNLEELFEDRSVKITDPTEALKALVPKLRREAHMVVVLSHLSQQDSRNIGVRVPGVDAVVGSHTPPGNRATYAIQGSSLVLSAPINGTGLGIVKFSVHDGSMVFSDATPVTKAAEVLPTVEQWLGELRDQYGSDDPSVIAQKDADAADRAERLKSKLADLRTMVEQGKTPRSTFFHYDVMLDGKQYPDDPAMHEFVREYRRSLKSIYADATAATSAAIEKTPGKRWYVGDAYCIACHKPQTEFWRQTAHAHAWETMEREEATYDLECIGCHTVGFLAPGGFDRPDKVEGFQNVQCENCHGPGSEHVSGAGFLNPRTIERGAEQMNCGICHNRQHSPNFKPETYLPRASCPPLDHQEPFLRGVYAKVAQDLEPRLENDKPAAGVFAALGELSLRLGRAGDTLDITSRGIDLYPHAVRLHSARARALDELGRSGEAIDELNKMFEESDGNTIVLRDLIDLLLHARDRSVRNPEAALEFASWIVDTGGVNDASFFAFKVEALRALGRIDDAIATLAQLRANGLTKVTAFNEMFTNLRAEREALREFTAPPPTPAPPGAGNGGR